MRETLLNVLVFVAILAASFLITNWFARTMYRRCAACGTLNAKRRERCRACGREFAQT
ncbi:MAG TPA: hypothetical protein VER32_00135 [Pyrinomonadaceae bacterium]|nr:hypothetical protein [Pyrinomonadaceae bacterium]